MGVVNPYAAILSMGGRMTDSVRDRVRSSNKVVQLNSTSAKAEYLFDRVAQDITNMVLWSDRFDFSKIEIKILWHFSALMPVADGVQVPLATTVSEIARDLRTDVGNVSRTLNRLIEQRIIFRNGSKYGINAKIDEWIPLDSIGDASKLKGRRTAKSQDKDLLKNQSELVEKPKDGLANQQDDLLKNQSEFVEKPKYGLANNHGEPWQNNKDDHGFSPWEDGSKTSDSKGSEVSKDHGEIMEIDPKRREEDLSSGSSIVSLDDLTREAVKLMAEGGYKIPGIDPALAFRKYVERIRSKNVDGQGFSVTSEIYLQEFVIPVIRDCPQEFRGDHAAWGKQFDICLGNSRKFACYTSIWKKSSDDGRQQLRKADNDGAREEVARLTGSSAPTTVVLDPRELRRQRQQEVGK